MDWSKVVLDSLEQLNYYNNDGGCELAPVFHGASRARLANIAACLVDGGRFLSYMNKSSYWEADLIAAARIFISKPELGVWSHEPQAFQEFLAQLRNRMLLSVSRKRIYRSPQRLNYMLDVSGITQMLKQLWLEQEAA